MNSIFLQSLLLALELSNSSAASPRYTAPPPVIQAFKTMYSIRWVRSMSIAWTFQNPKSKYFPIRDFTPENIKNLTSQNLYSTIGDITLLNNTTLIYKKKSITLRQGRPIYSGQRIKLISQNLVEPEDSDFGYITSCPEGICYRGDSYSYNISYYYNKNLIKNNVAYFKIIPSGYTGDKHRAVCYDVGYLHHKLGDWHPSILVIYTDKTAVAYRFDGYDDTYTQGGCKSISTDAKGTFLVPRIQPTKSTPLDHLNDPPYSDDPLHPFRPVDKRLVWYICTMEGCQHYIDPRPVYYSNIQFYIGQVTDWRTVPGTPPFIYDKLPLTGDWRTNQGAGPLMLDWFNSPVCKFASALGILSSVC